MTTTQSPIKQPIIIHLFPSKQNGGLTINTQTPSSNSSTNIRQIWTPTPSKQFQPLTDAMVADASSEASSSRRFLNVVSLLQASGQGPITYAEPRAPDPAAVCHIHRRPFSDQISSHPPYPNALLIRRFFFHLPHHHLLHPFPTTLLKARPPHLDDSHRYRPSIAKTPSDYRQSPSIIDGHRYLRSMVSVALAPLVGSGSI
ncbi:hypothetical protein PIB30_034994 [Stylosanthes scabra]|uniref:Uncharacterized protein n=1 Tax=Stylosanthes scabra TaxID=79078 RepID=A0ABU6RD99_9FABA|nr:hypothetical protein [Stylosanthes scabra]